MTQDDKEDAIEYIISQIESGYIDLGCHDENEISVITEAITKQKGVALFGNENNPVIIGDTVSGLCPVCMTQFICITPRYYKEKNYGYCKKCGQKLKW